MNAMRHDSEVPEDGLAGTLSEITCKMLDTYQRSPVLRMLVKLTPVLNVAEAGVLGTYAWFQHRRLQVFADEFTTLGLTLREEEVKRREFFDAYTSTARHVLTESRDAKIRLFARLFGQFVAGDFVTPIDIYEEHVLILDAISEREFMLLLLLHRHESKHPLQKGENRLQRTTHFWAEMEHDAESEFGVNKESLQALLTRMSRTGMYQEITGGYTDYGGGRGYLTTEFEAFLKALGMSPS
jgi:hypothetical protein